MKSLFAKHFFVYALIIIMGFTLLGSTFIYQVDRVSTEEKLALLEKSTAQAVNNIELYSIYSAQPGLRLVLPELGVEAELDPEAQLTHSLGILAQDIDGHIFVADPGGRLMYIASWEYGCRSQNQGVLPQPAVAAVQEMGLYEVSNSSFYGLLTGPCFIRGEPVQLGGHTVALAFIAVPPNNVLYHRLSQTFLVITLTVLFVILVVTILVVRGLVRPLSQMANAARSFVRGDFSTRVPLPARQDELYDMTVSFNSMAEAMENAENTRRGLIASVSHDLRTPMTTIGGFVDGILDGTIKPENQARYLRVISDEVKRLSRLANSMVEVSRLESGERELVRSVFDMSELVRRVVISFEQKLNEKGVRLALDIPEAVSIYGDHDSLFQVVYNLMDNAVKFTGAGGAITIYIADRAGGLEFHIVNTGSEIAQADIKRIFDRFFKGDPSRTSSASGSGLGLYIAKTVIGRHGGEIYAKSENGKTEFVFTLPGA